MPSDILGYSMYNEVNHQMEFTKGPVFANLLLADEINRTSSKTQAALLEAMAEGRVTVDNNEYDLPNPFITIATQNPITSGGTQALPDSQLDRFMVKLSMGYPDVENQKIMIMEDHGEDPIKNVQKVMSVEELIYMRKQVAETYISAEIAEYIALLVDATRHHEKIECGISPRGTKALANMAKACAYMYDRNYVVPEDIAYVIHDVFMHRLVLTPSARREKNGAETIINGILADVPRPAIAGEKKKYR
jgi:MoxR-like ATPase